MADDLAQGPRSELITQLCGDAHLSNFGVFASPERRLVFDLNDFDETHPGPFEWDVKRLAASLEIAGRDNGYTGKQRRSVVLSAVNSYRRAMREFAAQSNLVVWYAHQAIQPGLPGLSAVQSQKTRRTVQKTLDEARMRDNLGSLKNSLNWRMVNFGSSASRRWSYLLATCHSMLKRRRTWPAG